MNGSAQPGSLDIGLKQYRRIKHSLAQRAVLLHVAYQTMRKKKFAIKSCKGEDLIGAFGKPNDLGARPACCQREPGVRKMLAKRSKCGKCEYCLRNTSDLDDEDGGSRRHRRRIQVRHSPLNKSVRPVISDGFSRPSIASIVGAMSSRS